MPQETFKEGRPIAEQIPGDFNFKVHGMESIRFIHEHMPHIFNVLKSQMEKASHNEGETRNYGVSFGVDFRNGIGRILFQYTFSRTNKHFALVLSWHFNPENDEKLSVVLSPVLDNFSLIIGLEEVDLGIQDIQLLKELGKVESLCRGLTFSSEIMTSATLKDMLCCVAGIVIK